MSTSERDWLRKLAGRPRKSLGQHFLIDPHVTERLLRRAAIPPGSRVLEIGAGAGALTYALLAAGQRVVAVEKDPRLCALLRERAGGEPAAERLTIVAGDILEIDLPRAPFADRGESPWIVVGNLPYRVTTAVLEWTIRFKARIAWALFTVQREYGERLLARPSTPSYGSLTAWIGYHFAARKEFDIGPACFWPPPKIDSTVVRLTPHAIPPVVAPSSEVFERVVRAAFSRRRKMLMGALAAGLGLPRPDVARLLERAGVDGRKRAEQCGLTEFAALARELMTSDPLPPTR